MRKIILALVLICLANTSNAQCPAPSNLEITNYNITEATLDWTVVNGTGTNIPSTWEIEVLPNYVIGTPPPSTGTTLTNNHPYTITGLQPGCNVFFVRSYCTLANPGGYAAVASSTCNPNIVYYISTLSTQTFNLQNINVSPNPATNNFKINAETTKIEIYTITGQLIKQYNGNFDENHSFDIQNLNQGIYLIKITDNNNNNHKTIKLIKE